MEVRFVVGSVGLACAFQNLIERCLGLGSPIQPDERRRASRLSQHRRRDLRVFSRNVQGSVQILEPLLRPAHLDEALADDGVVANLRGDIPIEPG